VVHRDLKPTNIRRESAGFGAGENGRRRGYADLAGTPGFMVPEQIEGWPADTRSDIFASAASSIKCWAAAGRFPAGPFSPH